LIIFTIIKKFENDFQENRELAVEKHGYSSFEEWNENSRMGLNVDCWWEGG